MFRALPGVLDPPFFLTPRVDEALAGECHLMTAFVLPFPARLGLDGEQTARAHHHMVHVEWLGAGIVIERNVMEDEPAVGQQLVQLLADRALAEKPEVVVPAELGVVLQAQRPPDHRNDSERDQHDGKHQGTGKKRIHANAETGGKKTNHRAKSVVLSSVVRV